MDRQGIVMGVKSRVKQQLAKTMRREMTPAEASLWERLRRNHCGGLHFRRQQIIDGFIADFYCHEVGLVVEVDGGIHEAQAEYDALRDSIICARGLSVVCFTNEQILMELPSVLAAIQTAVRDRISTSSL